MYNASGKCHKLWMRPLSEDLRKRILEKRDQGYGPTDISNLFSVSRRAIYRLYDRYDKTGSFCAFKKGRPRGSELDQYKERILLWIDERADLTLEQLQQRCLEQLQLKVSVSNLDRVLKRWGLSYKKNSIRQRTES